MSVKMIAAALTVISATMAMAEVRVTDVVARPRYPWNGLVDISYTVVAEDTNADIFVTPYAHDDESGWTLFPKSFTGDGVGSTVKPGKHKMIWDSKADLGTYSSPSVKINILAGKNLAPYIVIDLSGGTSASNYPIRTSITGPNLNDDTCRTTELWMRLIPPGSFWMGSPANERGRHSDEDLHKVMIARPFYMGVFEITQKQYQMVMGDSSAENVFFKTRDRETRPMDVILFSQIRGDFNRYAPTSTEVAPESFIGKLRALCQQTVFSDLKLEVGHPAFDLPSEAQWEYACRQGTLTALNVGLQLTGAIRCSNVHLNGRYWYNAHPVGSSDDPAYIDRSCGNAYGTAKVGSYPPNGWGLYDMIGNVFEACRDDYVGNLGSAEVVDPIQSCERAHSYFVARSGSWRTTAEWCRSAARLRYTVNTWSNNDVGFRVCCPVTMR